MLPITNQVPYSSAVAIVGKAKNSGRTQPLQMRCECNGKYSDYIVKLWANPELFSGKHFSAREIYGSLLARSFGIKTPDISIIDIDPEFYLTQSNGHTILLKNSQGFNFGSKYKIAAKIFSSPVPDTLHSEAVRIFCFDMLIGNPDRRVRNPNVFQETDHLEVFDHEQAFPYSLPGTFLGGFPPGWIFIKEKWHKWHVFYSSIRKRDCNVEIDQFMNLVDNLSTEILDIIEEQIPSEWNAGNELVHIRDYLLNIRENSELFKRSLQEVLA